MKEYRLGIVLTIVISVCLIGTIVFMNYGDTGSADKKELKTDDNVKEKKVKKEKANKDKNEDDADAGTCMAGNLVAEKTWEMPKDLKEISGITWMGQDRVGAVDDNAGAIFIFNLASEKVEKQIKFSQSADYEGISYVNGNFFVMLSDGHLYEVNPNGKILEQYTLPLTTTDNVESLYFDAPNNRLLLAQKDGPEGSGVKEIYSFDLAGRKLDKKAVYKIDLADPVVNCGAEEKKGKKGKKKNNGIEIRPSELAIHPKTREIFIADGPNQRVLVLSPEGTPKYYLGADKKLFPQIEGLMFSPEGDLYISTEGIKEAGKISKVSIVMGE
jgi:uncharacterized protein YjiK